MKNTGAEKKTALDVPSFEANPEGYTIVDVRNTSEVKQQPIFPNSINIPLPELRDRVGEIPFEKPIVVHCAAGYRSAAGSSIISGALGNNGQVYDLGEAIKNFQQTA